MVIKLVFDDDNNFEFVTIDAVKRCGLCDLLLLVLVLLLWLLSSIREREIIESSREAFIEIDKLNPPSVLVLLPPPLTLPLIAVIVLLLCS